MGVLNMMNAVLMLLGSIAALLGLSYRIDTWEGFKLGLPFFIISALLLGVVFL